MCGGLIHPIAGRCKHCKEDLSALRAGRPQAAAPLPALQNGTAGHAAMAPLPQMIQQARAESAAILPPRPNHSAYALPKQRSMWKSWPMLVIVLASLAIVVAVVFMFWPPSADAGKRVLQPPPAPERMETNPLPPPGQGNNNGADPWGGTNSGGHSQNDRPAPRQTPDPPKAPAGNDPNDLLSPFGGVAGGGTDVMTALLAHACKKMKSCPSSGDDDILANACDALAMMGQSSAPPTCDAAKQCFDAIDKMDCKDAFGGSPMAAMASMQACTTAMTSC
jgi:hypothetical protein